MRTRALTVAPSALKPCSSALTPGIRIPRSRRRSRLSHPSSPPDIPQVDQAATLARKTFARRPRIQRGMYHIVASQRQIQSRRWRKIYRFPTALPRPNCRREPGRACACRPARPSRAWISAQTAPARDRRLDLGAPAMTSPALLTIDKDCRASRASSRRSRRARSALASDLVRQSRAQNLFSRRLGDQSRRQAASRRRVPATSAGCPARRRPSGREHEAQHRPPAHRLAA